MTIGENIIKHWKWYAIITALISIVGWGYQKGGSDREKEQRLFSTEKIRYETESYMEEKPSPADERMKLFLDSLNNVSAIKSRAMRDSIYKEEVIARKKTDSIVRLNADQMYQIKEILKKQND
jgi:hypothetical protein